MARFSRLVFSINMARSKRFWVTRKFWLRLLNVGFSLLKATLTESELIMSNGYAYVLWVSRFLWLALLYWFSYDDVARFPDSGFPIPAGSLSRIGFLALYGSLL